MKTILVCAFVAMLAMTAGAQTVRPPTDEEVVSAEGAARYREREAFLRALFGSGRVPPGCTLELADPSDGYQRLNLALYCKQPLTACDVPGVDCD